MAILVPSEKDIYFPHVNLVGDALTGAIRRAQMVAEGYWGANRPLELTSFTEIKSLSHNYQTAQLTYVPVKTTPVPTVEVRLGKFTDGFGRSFAPNEWTAIAATEWQLEYDIGEFFLKSQNQLYRSTEIKVSYTAGFDFSIDSPEIREIKAAVGGILSYLESLPGKHVTNLNAVGITYTGEFGKFPEYLLLPLRRHLPRISVL